MVTIADLKPDPRNARRHSERNMRVLMDSLQEVGAARSIVINENNVILAGNGLVEAAGQVGIENVKVVEADGNTIVAVKRTGLSAKEQKRLAILDNRAGELAEWEPDVLAELNLDGLLDGLWYENEIESLLIPVMAFEPNYAPETSTAGIEQADIEKVKKELEAKFKERLALKPVVCPHCAGEFFLDADKI